MKFSGELIFAAVSFMQTATRELGDIADEKIEAMFDAFDPGLRRQILMHMIKGDISGPIKLIRDTSSEFSSKIQVIKSVRAISGLGLKEAKDLVEIAESGKTATINGNFDIESRRSFVESLNGTGYRVL